jgi:hypothetical protein
VEKNSPARAPRPVLTQKQASDDMLASETLEASQACPMLLALFTHRVYFTGQLHCFKTSKFWAICTNVCVGAEEGVIPIDINSY